MAASAPRRLKIRSVALALPLLVAALRVSAQPAAPALPPLELEPATPRLEARCARCAPIAAAHNELASDLDELNRRIAQRLRGIAILDRVIASLEREIDALRVSGGDHERLRELERLLATRRADRAKDMAGLVDLRAQAGALRERLALRVEALRECEAACRQPDSPPAPAPSSPPASPVPPAPAPTQPGRPGGSPPHAAADCSSLEELYLRRQAIAWRLLGVHDELERNRFALLAIDFSIKPGVFSERARLVDQRNALDAERQSLENELAALERLWKECARAREIQTACAACWYEVSVLNGARQELFEIEMEVELLELGRKLPGPAGELPEVRRRRDELALRAVAAAKALDDCELVECGGSTGLAPPTTRPRPEDPGQPHPAGPDPCSSPLDDYLRIEAIEKQLQVADDGALLGERPPRERLREEQRRLRQRIDDCFFRELVVSPCPPCDDIVEELDLTILALRWRQLILRADRRTRSLSPERRREDHAELAQLIRDEAWLRWELASCLVPYTLYPFRLVDVAPRDGEGEVFVPGKLGGLVLRRGDGDRIETPPVLAGPPLSPTSPSPPPATSPSPPFPPPPPPTSVTPPSPPSPPSPQSPPPEPAATGCAALEGRFAGATSGGCEVRATEVHADGSTLVLTPFGENATATFAIAGEGASSTSSDLVILQFPSHHCDLSCPAPDRFDLVCRSSTGSCSERFRKR